MAIVCIAGKKKSGKTTFMEKLIPELAARGLKVATIKHDVHGFAMDTPGKDTWRHRRAGAIGAAISSPDKVAVVRDVDREMDLTQIAEAYFPDADLVLAEGFSRSTAPKVEVVRTKAHNTGLLTPETGLIALVTDGGVDPKTPTFGLEDAADVADFLIDRFFRPG